MMSAVLGYISHVHLVVWLSQHQVKAFHMHFKTRNDAPERHSFGTSRVAFSSLGLFSVSPSRSNRLPIRVAVLPSRATPVKWTATLKVRRRIRRLCRQSSTRPDSVPIREGPLLGQFSRPVKPEGLRTLRLCLLGRSLLCYSCGV